MTTWTLPPLILHPFAAGDTAEKLLEGSHASLKLHGMMPGSSSDREELLETVIGTRVQEIRMLYFLGKDLQRWVDQCADFARRTPELVGRGLRPQSFAAFLVEHTPETVVRKLQVWGVNDHKSLFSRSLGITTSFNTPPTREIFSSMFIENYHRFLDYLYVCYQNLEPFTEIDPSHFILEMYASAEYSQLLANEWGKQTS